jgi:hypothetical protein
MTINIKTEAKVFIKTDNTLDILAKSMCDRTNVRAMVASDKSVAQLRKQLMTTAAQAVKTIVARAELSLEYAFAMMSLTEQKVWIKKYTSYLNDKITFVLFRCFKLIQEEKTLFEDTNYAIRGN